MILPALLLAFSMAGQTPQSIECANFIDRDTESHSIAGGPRIALRVHAADDHNKESHLCQTDYSLVITRSDGTSTEQKIESIDDSWGRPIQFWMDGFALRGRRVIASIMERGEYPTFQVVVYSLESGKIETFEIPWPFIKQIPSSCRKAFRVVGTTRSGAPVVGFKIGTCDQSRVTWKLRQGPLIKGVQKPSIPIRLQDPSVIEPLEPEEPALAK